MHPCHNSTYNSFLTESKCEFFALSAPVETKRRENPVVIDSTTPTIGCSSSDFDSRKELSPKLLLPIIGNCTILDDFENGNKIYFLFYSATKVLKRVGKRIFAKVEGKVFDLSPSLTVRLVGNSLHSKEYRTLLISMLSSAGYINKSRNKAQSLRTLYNLIPKISAIADKADSMAGFLDSIVATVGLLKDSIEMSFLVDVILLLLQFSSGESLTVVTLTTFLVSLYRIYTKASVVYDKFKLSTPQIGVDPLCLSLLASFLPKNLMEILKRMSLFTNVKLCDEPTIIYDVLDCVFDFIHKMVEYMPCGETIKSTIVSGLSSFTFGSHFRNIREATELHAQWKKNPKVAMDKGFSSKFFNVFHKLSADPNIQCLMRRSGVVCGTMKDLERVSKCISAYESTSRLEPSCFIFEGPPGCFKSKLMAELIKCTKQTTYTHTVKNVKDGKDFYDTYNNEHNFVMDDVGQQGVSQWRSIINMVSNIKLPLDCADAPLKDTKFFNSENIFVTTNNFMNINTLLRDDCIDNIEALHRRGYVFDFKSVERTGSDLRGTLKFNSYSLRDHRFENVFPPEFCEFVKGTNFNLTPSLDLNISSRNDILVWMLSIINVFAGIKKNNADPNHLTVSDIDDVCSRSEIFCDSRSQYFEKYNFDFLSYYTTLVIEQSQKLVSSVVGTIKDYFNKTTTTDIFAHILSIVYSFVFGFLIHQLIRRFTSTERSLQQVFKNLKIKNPRVPSTPVQAIQRATYDMDIHHVDGVFTVCGLVSGHCIVTVAHAAFISEGYITIYKDRDRNSILVDHIQFKTIYRDVKADVAIFSLPRTFPTPFKNLSKFFINNQTHSDSYSNIDLRPHDQEYAKDLWYVSCVGEVYLPMFVKVSKANVIYSIDLDSDDYNMVKTTRSDLSGQPIGIQVGISTPGVCGSSIVHENGTVLGMHVAGNSDGIGTVIVWSVSVRDKIYKILFEDTKYTIDVPISDKVFSDFSGIKLDADAHIQTPKETNFILSPLAGVFPITREPANLSKYGPHTVKDIEKKSFSTVKNVDVSEINFARSVVDDYIDTFGDLSEKEIVAGTSLLAGLNPTSSNGFGCMPNKQTYVDFANHQLTPFGREECDKVEKSFDDGDIQVKDIVWYSTLKDELRSVAKDGKPRSFRVSPLFVQLLTKKYFGKMVEHIIQHKHFSGVMVGVNPFAEWGDIYANMRQCNGTWAGDIGNYDGNMLPQVQSMVSSILLKHYSGGHPKAAEFLLQNLSTTFVAINDDAYLTTHSLPSGSFLTAIYNSLVNKAYTAMWFYRNVSPSQRSVTLFHRDVVDYVYGDDKLNGVRSDQYPNLNAITMESFFTSLGMTFTDAIKKPITTPYQPLDEVSFLKRTFRVHPILNKIVCPLDKETLYSGLSWLDSTKEGEIVLTDKINNFQREIFLHWDTYDADISHLEYICKNRGIFFQRLPLKYLLNLFTFECDQVPILSWGGPLYRIYDSISAVETIATSKPQQPDVSGSSSENHTTSNSPIHDSSDISTIDTITGDFYSNLSTRSLDSIPDHYDADIPIRSVPPNMRQNYDSLIGKPFFLKNLRWDSSYGVGTELQTLSMGFPNQLIDTTINDLVKVPFRASALYRMKACLLVQVSGTPMHQGTLLVAALPGQHVINRKVDINTAIASPHAFLSANNATSACIPIPFYAHQNLIKCDLDDTVGAPENDNNYARISVSVLNPLVVPSSGSVSLTVSLHVVFENADFYIPHVDPAYVQYNPFSSVGSTLTSFLDNTFISAKTSAAKISGDLLDMARGTIRAYTGLHNENKSIADDRKVTGPRNFQNVVDASTTYERLNPYSKFTRIVGEPVFETFADEMDMKYILSKKYFVDTFAVDTTLSTGAMVFSRPITPIQENNTVLVNGVKKQVFSTPLQRLALMSRYWRGGMKLYIQSSMTGFHFAKLAIVRDYSPNSIALTQHPDFNSVSNLMVDTVEFSAGGQIHCIDLPYCSHLNQLECTNSIESNALQHGIYYVYLAQPLTVNGSVATKINFNVFVGAAEDFELYGFASGEMISLSKPPPTLGPGPFRASLPEFELATAQSGGTIPLAVPTQQDLQPKPVFNKSDGVHTTFFKPIMNVRDYLRRLVPVATKRLTYDEAGYNQGVRVFPISELLGLTAPPYTSVNDNPNAHPIASILRMFYGATGGIKVRTKVSGTTDIKVLYVPPGTMYQTPGVVVRTSPMPLNGAANAAVRAAVADRYENNPDVAICFPLLGQDIPVVVHTNPSTSLNLEAERYYSASYAVAEFEVPNCSPYRFIGDSSRGLSTSYNDQNPQNDFGNLIISLRPQAFTTGEKNYLSEVEIEISIGASDEFRVGFNCLALPCYTPNILDSTILYTVTPYNNSLNTPSAVIPSAPRSVILDYAPRAYFTQT